MNMRSIRWFHSAPAAVATLALVLGPSAASAYCHYSCLGDFNEWGSHSVTFRAGKQSFAPGPWRDALAAARDRWNESPADITIGLQWNETSLGLWNLQEEVWFTDDQDLLEGAPARTFTSMWCGTMAEADIVFDANWAYSAGTSKSAAKVYSGSKRMFRGVAIHEMGHGIGLCHVNTRYNIMGSDSTHVHANGGTLRNYAGEDGNNGAVALYGYYSTPIEDVSVTHWKYAGKSGEYSTHQRTAIYNTSNAVLPSNTVNGEPVFDVNRGQQVKVEFTYENNGKSSHNVAIGYYVSTNDLITTSDTLIGTGAINGLKRDGVLTTNNTFLTIPTNLTPGQTYYIGAIINYNNAFSEITGANNATYIGIKVH